MTQPAAPGGPPDPSARGPRGARGPVGGLVASIVMTLTLLGVLVWATCG